MHLIVGIVLFAIYWYFAVYAAPLAMAFLFGWIASSLGGNGLTIAVAAIIGAGVFYGILQSLRSASQTWPPALIIEKTLVTLPSFLVAFAITHDWMRDTWERGAIESGLVSVFIGLIFGGVAYNKYLEKHVSGGPSA